MNITLYNCTAEHNRVYKIPFLTNIGTIEGTLRDSESVTELQIEMQVHPLDFNLYMGCNYIYIPDFNRYYFVVDIEVVSTQLLVYHLSIDVLMSYYEPIINLKGFIDRNEIYDDDSKNLVDKKRVVYEGYDVDDIPISNSVFDDTIDYNPHYILSGFKVKVVEPEE